MHFPTNRIMFHCGTNRYYVDTKTKRSKACKLFVLKKLKQLLFQVGKMGYSRTNRFIEKVGNSERSSFADRLVSKQGLHFSIHFVF